MVRGGTYALTKRTAFRKAFLAPWDPLVIQTWLYVLAGAQHRSGVSIHHTMLNVTHHHTSVTTPSDANLPRFTEYAHREMSKAMNALLSARRYEAPGQLFEDRQTHQMRLLDAPACMSHITYERLNGVAAGLVDKPEHMPGCRFDYGLWRGRPLIIKRPPIYFNPRTTEAERELHFEVDPLTFLEFQGDLDAIVYHYRHIERLGVQAFRKARTTRVLGAKRLRRIHPYNEPTTSRESGRTVIPTFKVGARGVTGRVIRVRSCQEVTAFRVAHADAQSARRKGDVAAFPAGTYKMRVEHGVDVAECGPDALVTAPGRTLEEVVDALGQRVVTTTSTTPEQVAHAFAEEATGILVEDEISFASLGVTEVSGKLEIRSRADVHRTSKVVVLRDERRGRPATKGREPPA